MTLKAMMFWHLYLRKKLSKPNIEITKSLGQFCMGMGKIIDAIFLLVGLIFMAIHTHTSRSYCQNRLRVRHVIFADTTHQPATFLAKSN
jgi:hypothetical protein